MTLSGVRKLILFIMVLSAVMLGANMVSADSGAVVSTTPPGAAAPDTVIIIPPQSSAAGQGASSAPQATAPITPPGQSELPPGVSSADEMRRGDSGVSSARPKAAFPSAPGAPPPGTSAPNVGSIQPVPAAPPAVVPGPVSQAPPAIRGDAGATVGRQPDVIVITPAAPPPPVQDRGYTPQTSSNAGAQPTERPITAIPSEVPPPARVQSGDAGASAAVKPGQPETVYSDIPGAPREFTGKERGGSQLVPGGTPVTGLGTPPSSSQAGRVGQQDTGATAMPPSASQTAPPSASAAPAQSSVGSAGQQDTGAGTVVAPSVPQAVSPSTAESSAGMPPSGSVSSSGAAGDMGGRPRAVFPSAPGPPPQGTAAPRTGEMQAPSGSVPPPQAPSGLTAGDTGVSQQAPIAPRSVPRY